MRILTPEEMVRLLQANKETRWYPLWAWFATTGVRMGEALAVRWSDINWERRSVTIQQAVSGGAAKRVLKTPKTASGSRTLALGPRSLMILREPQAQQLILRGWPVRPGRIWD